MRTALRRFMMAVVGVALFGLAIPRAMAQAPKFKQGDRVEVEINHGGFDSQFARVKKGTITQVDAGTNKRYVIQLDPLPGQLPVTHTMPFYDQDTCLRLIGGAAPTIKADQLLVDQNGTVLADRQLLDCWNLPHGGRNGQPPPPDLLRKLIRCLYEKPSPVGQDGATRMDITDFTLGAPHRWVVGIDSGQGTTNTIVYPVHVRWNMKTFYHSRNVQVTGKEMTFTCFADAVNLWQCGFATGPNREGITENIVVKQ
jgi:hypothetical protein